jgi:ligand-binding SRPBCC domain-containing protein
MAGNRIIVDVAGTQAGRVEIDVHPLFLPPLVYEDDVLVIPHNFCGIRIRKAGEFLWLNASGQLVEAENHGDVLEMGEEYYLGGIEFTGPINSCQQNHPWYFPIPLSFGGNGPQFGAQRLVIQLNDLTDPIEFIDRAREPLNLKDLYDWEKFQDLDDKFEALSDYCQHHQFKDFCESDGEDFEEWSVELRKGTIEDESPSKEPPDKSSIFQARHGLSEAQYQRLTTKFAAQGVMPTWVNFYNVGSEVFVNVIYIRAKTRWLARHNLSGSQYQELYDTQVKNGSLKLKHVDSYVDDGQIKYAVILIEGSSANMPAYHGITAAEHQEEFDAWTAQGFVPVNLSVTSIDGQRRYAGFYEKKTVGGLAVKSFLTGEQYQTFVDEQVKAKREIAYLKSYNHKGDIHYSAIFYGNINRSQVLRHGMSSSGYQREFDQWVGQEGYALKLVTAAARGSNPVFAAVWQK